MAQDDSVSGTSDPKFDAAVTLASEKAKEILEAQGIGFVLLTVRTEAGKTATCISSNLDAEDAAKLMYNRLRSLAHRMHIEGEPAIEPGHA
jgi:hypothetical protein